MTSSNKALLKYGPFTVGALICAVVAGLGIWRVAQPLAGEAKSACLAAVAVAMAIQGATMFPRKWESRLIVKPHALAAGSMLLLAGSALLLALLLTGCSPVPARLRAPAIMTFTTATRQWLGTCSALDVPSRIAARSLSRKRTDKNRPLARGCDPWASGSVSQSVCAQNRASFALGGTNCCR
jgi:hypothetical protein